MAIANSYDPKKVNVSVAGHRVVGFADGTMISGERNEDKQSLYTGSKGEVTFVENADTTGMVEITLKHNSASLSEFKDLFNTGQKFPFYILDLNDGSKIVSIEAKVASMGSYERSDDVSDKTITLLCNNFDEFY